MTDPAFAVADDDDGGKTEPAATFDHFSDTVNTDQFFD
jgi:hypothetical protein